MARESWIDVYGLGHDRAKFIEALKHFESIVRADEREIEREACAKVCDDLAPPCGYNLTEISFWDVTSLECAAAIRARSKHD
jgi:hypothetical protein